jgi:hypothetical protein
VPAKDWDKRRATWNAWYHRTKHLKKAKVPRQNAVKLTRLRGLSAWLAEIKSELRCGDCGIDHPGCLVFHHVERSTKEVTLADAVRRGWSRERIRSEMAKCAVLCSNCHAKLHARERTRGVH